MGAYRARFAAGAVSGSSDFAVNFGCGKARYLETGRKVTMPGHSSASHDGERKLAASAAPASQSLSIRAAVASDVALLKTLIHEFAKFQRMEVLVSEDALLRDGFGARPQFRALIAEWQRQPAGYVVFFDYYSTFRGAAGIFLEDVYVREEFRGKGIGKALLVRLAAIAQKERCTTIVFNVLDWNHAAINVYRGMGATFLDDLKTVCLEGGALEALSQADGLR
jgi:GNAT superfamily N-acetyltransferase